MNGLAGCYVSTIGKPHEYFDLTGSGSLTGPCGGGKEAARGVQNQGQDYRGVAG